MANDLNQCNFIGRLGKDVALRYMPSGAAVANVSIAVGSQWRDKDSGEKKESTEWVNISAYGKLAEIMGEYLKKGSKIFITGKMKTRKWQDNNGNDRYTTDIIASQMQMLDSRSESGGHGSQGGHQQQGRGQRQQSQARPQHQAPADEYDDDIPF